jgi:hypothetical protein
VPTKAGTAYIFRDGEPCSDPAKKGETVTRNIAKTKLEALLKKYELDGAHQITKEHIVAAIKEAYRQGVDADVMKTTYKEAK